MNIWVLTHLHRYLQEWMDTTRHECTYAYTKVAKMFFFSEKLCAFISINKRVIQKREKRSTPKWDSLVLTYTITDGK